MMLCYAIYDIFYMSIILAGDMIS